MPRSVRIGNAQAFWGDRRNAAAEMLSREPDLDFLTLDYLAEVSMSILALQRERDSEAGFARDFLEVVRSLAPYWSSGGRCRLITNAGGLNPGGCAEACRAALKETGCRSMRIGIVTGDDVLDVVRRARSTPADSGPSGCSDSPFHNLDTGAAISEVADRLATANAYLGAAPILEALAGGADIVVTGRVADPSLTVAACIHHLGWSEDDLDRLAGATVAGHLIECGTQVTGGISTDWLDVPDPAHIGFPIVEVSDDGSCIVTKPRGTGGCVTARTVKEQLVYEIGDPDNYLSPDVSVTFLSLKVDELGEDRVRVTGAKGRAAPSAFKVSATYRDGYRAAGTLTMFGRNAVAKARRCGEIVLKRVEEAGHVLRDSIVECLGCGECGADLSRQGSNQELIETVLRIAVEADSQEPVERFTKELMALITAGPQGTTGYAEGRPRVHAVFRYWPCLIERTLVTPQVHVLEAGGAELAAPQPWPAHVPLTTYQSRLSAHSVTVVPHPSLRTLHDIAYARSGDKGTSANIGVIARSADDYETLRDMLTADLVAQTFAAKGVTAVERFELPNLSALNFVLHGVLSRGLRIDAQGKALAQALLELPVVGP